MPRATKQTVEPLLATEARELDLVDPAGTYCAVIQLGARRRWRSFNGGRWERDPERDRPNDDPRKARIGYRHIPAVHDVGPVSGTTMNGLISSHNKWVSENHHKPELSVEEADGRVTKRMNPAADVSRQLLVLSFEPTNELPTACMSPVELARLEREREIGAIRDATSALSQAVSAFTTAVKGGAK